MKKMMSDLKVETHYIPADEKAFFKYELISKPSFWRRIRNRFKKKTTIENIFIKRGKPVKGYFKDDEFIISDE